LRNWQQMNYARRSPMSVFGIFILVHGIVLLPFLP